MADRTRVVLYGGSLYMAGLAVSLQTDPALDVIHIRSGAADIEQVLQTAPTAAVVFEIDALPSALVIDFISTHPGLSVIGMDLTSEDILLLSGQHVCVGTMTDMIGLLTGALRGEPSLLPREESSPERGQAGSGDNDRPDQNHS